MKLVRNIIVFFLFYFFANAIALSQNNYQSGNYNSQNSVGQRGHYRGNSENMMNSGQGQQNNSNDEQVNRHKASGREYMMNLRQNNPDEFQILMELRQTNPNEFQNEMRGRISKQFSRQDRQNKDNTSYCDLAKKYKNSSSLKEKKQLRDELKNILEKDFAKKQQSRKDNINKMTETLDKLKKQINDQGLNKNNYLNQQLNNILE
jgi:hypothetical protein